MPKIRKRSETPIEHVFELGLTAILRARPADAEKTLVEFTEMHTRQYIRANAFNALTRLRAKNANEQPANFYKPTLIAIVRANAARVLGAAEDKDAFDLLLNAAMPIKIRVSAFRRFAPSEV